MSWSSTYQFNFPTTIRFGKGIINELGKSLKENNLKSPLLVSDPGLSRLPIYDKVSQILADSDLKITHFNEIDKNPVKSNVLKGTDTYRDNSCDCVIGFGGGASIDVARAIALLVNHPKNDLFDFDDAKGGDRFVINPIPYFVAIPTTSGTGSEVGRSTVISDDETHEKKILFSPELMPRKVFADPELTMELPPFVTAATGMDALTHNIEAYLAKGLNPICDGIALEGIKLVFESLEGATNDPNIENRGKMQLAALMGATAFQKGLGVVHSLAHPLSTVFNMHHGLANAIMLPFALDFNAKECEKKYLNIMRYCNLEGETDKDFINHVKELNKKINLPNSLSKEELDWTNSNLERLVDLAMKDPCHQSNPVEVKKEDFLRIYKDAYNA